MYDDDTYRTDETPHEDMRLVFWGDVYIGWYNPMLDEVLEA